MPKAGPTSAADEAVGSDRRVPRPRASREATTERILDAAEELFASRNPRDVTIREVAEKAGVTHALVHQYVGTKEDLLSEVLQRVATNRTAAVEEGASLEDVIRWIAQDVLARPLHTKSLVRSAMDGVEYLSLKDRIETGQALLGLAERDRAQGRTPEVQPKSIDPRVVIAVITSLLFGWSALENWVWPVFGLDPKDKDDIYRQVEDISAYISDLALEQPEATGSE